MFKTVSIRKQYDKSFTYYKFSTIDKRGGKNRHLYDIYTDFNMIFIPETNRVQFDEDGNISQGLAYGVIPVSFFNDNNISPSNSDRIKGEDDVVYRIVAIEDYSRLPHSKIYYVHLKRDELNVNGI